MKTDYEQLAGRYDEDRAQWSFSPDDIIEELLASKSRVRAVDIGCGTGRWLTAQLDFFAGSRVTLVGVDPSTAMLAHAHRKGLGGLVCAPAEDLPLGGASADFIVSSYAFHHFVDKERALDEVARVLTPGGVFRLDNIEPTAAEGWWLYEFFPEAVTLDAARFWPPARIAGALEARHFVVEIGVDSGTQEIAADEALADAERRIVSQLAALDDAAYERGLTRLRQVAARPDATVTTTRSHLSVIARSVR